MGIKFAHIRELFDAVIDNCRANYVPEAVVTVDEQLLPFRGRCPFRIYIPNKPDRYGIKLFMLNDANTYYCINAIPFLGAESVQTRNITAPTQGEHYVMELMRAIMYDENYSLVPGRTVVCDNWFTTMGLAKKLLEKQHHLVGTIRPKPYLPTKAIWDEKLQLGENVAVFNHQHKINVVYKLVKPRKICAVMTTCHNNFTLVEKTAAKGFKTEAHMFYNWSKGGTDCFDMMCAHTTTHRKTRRWPCVVFFGLLNIIINNSWIIYQNQTPVDGTTDRLIFTQDMAHKLCIDWAYYRQRNHARYLANDTKWVLNRLFPLPEQIPVPRPIPEQDLVPDQIPVPIPAQDPVPVHVPGPEGRRSPSPPVEPQLPVQPDVVRRRAPKKKNPAQIARERTIEEQASRMPGRLMSRNRVKCRWCKGEGKGKYMCTQCQTHVCFPNHSVLLCPLCWTPPGQEDVDSD